MTNTETKTRAEIWIEVSDTVLIFLTFLQALVFTHRSDYWTIDRYEMVKAVGLWQFCDGCSACHGEGCRNRLNMFGWILVLAFMTGLGYVSYAIFR